jgi:hypothetical protein
MGYTAENDGSTLPTIIAFLESIGIPCRPAGLGDDTFLPGVDIRNGHILYDEKKLLSPGDLLHEAGHIAVLQPGMRASVTSPDVSGNLSPPAAEMAAIAWSWAALRHLELQPEVVFHERGYRDDSQGIIENFSNRRYIGVSILQWLGMTIEDKDKGSVEGYYPVLTNWLRSG